MSTYRLRPHFGLMVEFEAPLVLIGRPFEPACVLNHVAISQVIETQRRGILSLLTLLGGRASAADHLAALVVCASTCVS